jgi:hypothetical protein
MAYTTLHVHTSASSTEAVALFALHDAAWPSYNVLRTFWLDSFATNAVDIQSHR